MDPFPVRIRRMFDEIAPTYDLLNRAFSLRTDQAWRRRAAVASLGPGRERVLDVCCGTGDLAFEIEHRGARTVGTDFSLRMLRLAAGKRRGDRPLLAAADTLRLPFRSGTFDACTVAFGLRNTDDALHALREMARVVRPGGRVVVLEFTRPANPLLRFYTECLLPLIGDLVSRSRRRAYTYLPRSVGAWPDADSLTRLLECAGLVSVSFLRLFPGLALLHSGIRP